MNESSTKPTPGGQADSVNPDNNVLADMSEQLDSAEQSATESEPSAEETLKAEAARLKDQLLRTLADFDNFRKRSRREVSDAERMAREEILRELLPIFDNLERAGQHAVGSTDIESLKEGIQMVMRQFNDTLNKLGVERILSVGQPFDPAVHEAVQQIESSEIPAGAVAQELLAGYRVGERLIRPAMVVVAKPSSN